ncbi:PREDICTED: putative receptor-like protein kinase At4g00960 [Erythranthe guttata]|nr:PREDICTED: putative receptor-like protein kinase At4g00960 [Erythranthe guttata]|eukprot:XP_012841178.1 PREDICTED: putative receptor-like protein kinase At4g00960 [Erythranthe guttata]
MAPEYTIRGQFSIKSDVYSFGVLVLEIVSGQKKVFVQNGEVLGNLLSYAWRSRRDGTTEDMIDPILRETYGSQPDMMKCIHIALLCVQENGVERPTMASVVLMLNSSSIALPMPLKPGFYFSGNEIRDETDSPSRRQLAQCGNVSNNDCSITNLYPR